MINLLPIENKKNVWHDYRGRRLVIIASMVMFLLLTGIILLTAFYFSALLGWQPRSSVSAENNEKDREVYELKLKDLREKVNLLSGADNTFVAADLFSKVSQVGQTGVKIESFRREINPAGEPVFRLQIAATSRKAAADYITKLHKVPGIKDVVYPILTSDKNLSVTLELILVNKKS